MISNRILLLGCGILKKEIEFLVEKNKWNIDLVFFDSSLHCSYNQLSQSLTSGLCKYSDRTKIVFYGECHPQIDQILSGCNAIRTAGQNCIEMLLGHETFTREVSDGAFFMLEEWAARWKQLLDKSFGTQNIEIIREIFKGDRKYYLCIRTPCSGNFTDNVKIAAEFMDIPIRWMDTTLDHLEDTLLQAIDKT